MSDAPEISVRGVERLHRPDGPGQGEMPDGIPHKRDAQQATRSDVRD
jgi:hypothetical protein